MSEKNQIVRKVIQSSFEKKDAPREHMGKEVGNHSRNINVK